LQETEVRSQETEEKQTCKSASRASSFWILNSAFPLPPAFRVSFCYHPPQTFYPGFQETKLLAGRAFAKSKFGSFNRERDFTERALRVAFNQA
jgi:hypothetical protein